MLTFDARLGVNDVAAHVNGPDASLRDPARTRPAPFVLTLAAIVVIAAYILGPHREFERAGNPWTAAQTIRTAVATGDSATLAPLLQTDDTWARTTRAWIDGGPRPAAMVGAVEQVGPATLKKVTLTFPATGEPDRTFLLDARHHWWGDTYTVVGPAPSR